MYKIINKIWYLLIGIAIVSGCSGFPTVQNVPIPKLEVDPESAIIILNRPSALIAAWNNPSVFDNGMLIGEISNGGVLKWSRQEGNMALDIWHVTSGTSDRHTFPNSEIHTVIEVKKNKVYTFNYKFGGVLQPSAISLEGDDSSFIRVTSNPSGAKIYTGPSFDKFKYTGYKTPYTFKRKANTNGWAPEYYQVCLDGYDDSPIIFKNNSFGDREINFDLKKQNIVDDSSFIRVTSNPSGAMIYAGTTSGNLKYSGYKTPYTVAKKGSTNRWPPEYYQVRLAGYDDTSIVYKNNPFGDRDIHFELTKQAIVEPPTVIPPNPLPKKPPPQPLPNNPEEEYDFTGTGWVTHSGFIITNYHVIKGQNEVRIRFSNSTQKTFPAEVVLSDMYNDLAILKIQGERKYPVPGLTISSQLPSSGEDVFTIGYPDPDKMGIKSKTTNGIVSALSGFKDDPRFIQTNVAIQKGNSGGPLLNMKGQVVGVITKTLRVSVTEDDINVPQNVNYAVKSAYVLALLSSLPTKKSYPMVTLKSYKREDIVNKVQDSIVQVIVKRIK